MPSLHRFLLIALIVLLPMANPVKAADAGIASVIESQLNAFRSDDIAGAYSHAAPNIRQMFPTAEIFGTMVERGYAAIRRPSQWAMGRSREVAGNSVFQEVLLTGPDGKSWRAVYQMERQPDGKWLISGVSMKEADLPSI